MMGLSFVAMYALMYAMVDQWANVYNNVNQFYMAGLMAAPMLAMVADGRIRDGETIAALAYAGIRLGRFA